eukprot:NODE_1565_length_2435_cov_12.435442.p1 GENE.NODE_1565_length_2435_cov_12.435442~~NODE_1565_length_2435_cov_12.435442.p1  ORF type:complete len:756 (-),score=197.89 NODE_1565_length_2435_cov_12.435442:21-2288(-)
MRWGAVYGATATRLSQCVGLTGPIVSIDTACSASLVANHLGATGLRENTSDRRKATSTTNKSYLACGNSLMLGPFSFISLCGPRMLSMSGRCMTFNATATGYARSEGISQCYVKTLNGEAEVDTAAGILMGSHVNQDGRSATITAPNGPSQQACCLASLRESGLLPTDLNFAECHGTGTALGDPIEVTALRAIMEPRTIPIPFTSIKSNFGHGEGNAGQAGLFKVIATAMIATVPPNCHITELNPHLSVEGFPVLLETECLDLQLNANLGGVSSFGWAGTNANAGVWARCLAGARKAEKKAACEIEDIMQYTTTCPVTLAPIDIISGEPPRARRALDDTYCSGRLRDEFAPYDISPYAYKGSYRFRLGDTPEDVDALPVDGVVFIRGSWSCWAARERMTRAEDGWNTAIVVLGESRCESFRLSLNDDGAEEIYPVAKRAAARIHIDGPDANADGRCWMIDGRNDRVPVGTLYRVSFRWGSERRVMRWEPIDMSADVPQPLTQAAHLYYICGSWQAFRPRQLRRCTQEGNAWEASVKIGISGREEFHFVRDRDDCQLIYPAVPLAMKTSVRVRGPDHMGKDKNWLVRGPAGDTITVRLEVEDGAITISAHSALKGTKVWYSAEGWSRHDFHLVCSDTDCVPLRMMMVSPGVFKCGGIVTENNYDAQLGRYTETFQIAVDADAQQVYRPAGYRSQAGECMVMEPDSDLHEEKFLITARTPYTEFEVVLDLNAEDVRRRVTCNVGDMPALPEPTLALE